MSESVTGSSRQHATDQGAFSPVQLRARDVRRLRPAASEFGGQIVAVGIGVPSRTAVRDRDVIPLGVGQMTLRAAPGIRGNMTELRSVT